MGGGGGVGKQIVDGWMDDGSNHGNGKGGNDREGGTEGGREGREGEIEKG